MKDAQPTPWPGLLLAALKLGITPEVFWRLSVREWQALTASQKRTGFGRGDLSRLLSAFPDKETSR